MKKYFKIIILIFCFAFVSKLHSKDICSIHHSDEEFRKIKIFRAALHEWILSGRSDLIQRALDKKEYCLNYRNENGRTPLYEAAVYGQTEAIDVLVSKGANINLRNLTEDSPLHGASEQGNHITIKKIIELGGEINVFDRRGKTPVQLAIRYALQSRNIKALKVLAHYGADLNTEFGSHINSNTLLNFLIDNGFLDYVKYIFTHTKSEEGFPKFKIPNINGASSLGKTPLHIAIRKQLDTSFVHFLIKYGAKWSPVDISSQSPMYNAVLQGVDELFHNRVPKTSIYQKGEENLRYLVHMGASVNTGAAISHTTPIHHWAFDNNIEAISYLIEAYGANANVMDAKRNSPLHLAIENNSYRLTKMLLIHGSSFKHKNKIGYNSLHLASSLGRWKILKLLILFGGDVFEKDNFNRDAFQIAKFYKQDELLMKLCEYYKKIKIHKMCLEDL